MTLQQQRPHPGGIMRTLRATLILAGLFAGNGAGLHAADGAPGASKDLAPVAWLQGCWRAESPTRVVEENWTEPRGGAMIGVSLTVQGDSLREFELVAIRQVGGVLAYEAHPSSQAAATFLARESTESKVVFANPGHDYPQEIGYQRIGSDSLLAWIDGRSKGKSRRVEFRYARVNCPQPHGSGRPRD